MYNRILSDWENLCCHPSIIGRMVTLSDPKGVSLRGPLESASVNKLSQSVKLIIASGKLETKHAPTQPSWNIAGRSNAVITFTLTQNCSAPQWSAEATTATLEGGVTIAFSHAVLRDAVVPA